MKRNHQNHELAVVLKNDHRRLKIRCVESEKRKVKHNRAKRNADLRKQDL